jgi:hypothetical protein
MEGLAAGLETGAGESIMWKMHRFFKRMHYKSQYIPSLPGYMHEQLKTSFH